MTQRTVMPTSPPGTPRQRTLTTCPTTAIRVRANRPAHFTHPQATGATAETVGRRPRLVRAREPVRPVRTLETVRPVRAVDEPTPEPTGRDPA